MVTSTIRMRTALFAVLAAVLAATAIPGALERASASTSISYATHSQTVSWGKVVVGGVTAGTLGKRLEAIQVGSYDVTYRGYVQSIGWQGWVNAPKIIGTTGQAKRLEAFEAKLTGPDAATHNLEYRSYVRGIGWQGWVSNGAMSGTTGQAKQIEQVQLKVTPKVAAPTSTPTSTPTATVTPTPTPTATTPAGATKLVFTADTGMESTGQAVLAAIGANNPSVTNILGDFAYKPASEAAFCNQVNSRIPGKVAVVAGNHEEYGAADGYIDKYITCMPNEVGAVGTYGKDFYYDINNVRVVMVSPDIANPAGTKTYKVGTAEREWLKTTVRDAKAAGKWTILGMHHPCFSIGMHGCADTTPEVTNLAIGLGVDIVFAGHDHNYMRTKQLRGTTASPVVIDSDNAFAAQTETSKGSVFVVVGNGGHNPRTIGSMTSIWAKANGTNSTGGFVFGFGELTATDKQLSFRHVSVATGSYTKTLTDSFTITR